MTKLIELDKVLEILDNEAQEVADNGKDFYWILAAKSDIQELPTTETTWIPVEESLPESNRRVLAYFANRDINFAKIYEWEWITYEFWTCIRATPTHWKPLPKSPK